MTAAVAGTVARGAAARAGAGAAARKGAAKAAGNRTAASKTGAKVVGGQSAAQQRAAIDRIKANRAPEPVDQADDDAPASTAASSTSKGGSRPSLPDALTDQRGAPKAFRTDPVRAANVGGGFVLGAMAHVLALAYLRGGKDGVKRLLRAKFFNQVTPS